MRANTLITGLLLLSLSQGQKWDPKIISFSPGIKLFVKGIHVRTATPKLQILLPLGLWTETSDALVLTCIITGLHKNNIPYVTWKINNSPVSAKYTVVDIFRDSDGTFTALGILHRMAGLELMLDDVYSCEVKLGEITYYEEVSPSRCKQTP